MWLKRTVYIYIKKSICCITIPSNIAWCVMEVIVWQQPLNERIYFVLKLQHEPSDNWLHFIQESNMWRKSARVSYIHTKCSNSLLIGVWYDLIIDIGSNQYKFQIELGIADIAPSNRTVLFALSKYIGLRMITRWLAIGTIFYWMPWRRTLEAYPSRLVSGLVSGFSPSSVIASLDCCHIRRNLFVSIYLNIIWSLRRNCACPLNLEPWSMAIWIYIYICCLSLILSWQHRLDTHTCPKTSHATWRSISQNLLYHKTSSPVIIHLVGCTFGLPLCGSFRHYHPFHHHQNPHHISEILICFTWPEAFAGGGTLPHTLLSRHHRRVNSPLYQVTGTCPLRPFRLCGQPPHLKWVPNVVLSAAMLTVLLWFAIEWRDGQRG